MIAGVLLAAGMARRFGAPKLVAPLRGAPLVRHSVGALLASSLDAVWVVVGADAAGVRVALDGLDVRFVDHPAYARGLGGSIAAGIAALPSLADAAVIALGDQPDIPAAVVDAVIGVWRRNPAAIVAPRYRGVVASPVLFAREIFPELLRLEGDVGARSVVQADPARVRWLEIDAAVPADVDTRDDLDLLGRG